MVTSRRHAYLHVNQFRQQGRRFHPRAMSSTTRQEVLFHHHVSNTHHVLQHTRRSRRSVATTQGGQYKHVNHPYKANFKTFHQNGVLLPNEDIPLATGQQNNDANVHSKHDKFQSRFNIHPQYDINHHTHNLYNIHAKHEYHQSNHHAKVQDDQGHNQAIDHHHTNIYVQSQGANYLHSLLQTFIVRLRRLVSPRARNSRGHHGTSPRNPIRLTNKFSPRQLAPLQVRSPIRHHVKHGVFRFRRTSTLSHRCTIFRHTNRPTIMCVLHFNNITLRNTKSFDSRQRTPLLQNGQRNPTQQRRTPPQGTPHTTTFHVRQSRAQRRRLSTPNRRITCRAISLICRQVVARFFFFLTITTKSFNAAKAASNYITPQWVV